MLINCAALNCVADDAEHNMHTYTYVHTHRNAHVHVSYTHISTHTYPNKCAYYIFQIRKHELHRFIFLVTYVQITSAVLRDPSGCDALADQVLSSLQSRYADGVDSSREINEVIGMHNFFVTLFIILLFILFLILFLLLYLFNQIAYISRIVTDCTESLGRLTVLLPKQ